VRGAPLYRYRLTGIGFRERGASRRATPRTLTQSLPIWPITNVLYGSQRARAPTPRTPDLLESTCARVQGRSGLRPCAKGGRTRVDACVPRSGEIRLASAVLALMGSVIGAGSREARAQSGCPEIIVQVFGDRAPQACRVAYCESTWRSWAISPDGRNVGYFQINRIWGAYASTDPATNVNFAYRLSDGGRDWSHWSCKP
jgi:hypothetical protein